MTEQTTERIAFAGQPETIDDIRGWGDLLYIWRLCGKAACRRAHACKTRGAASRANGASYDSAMEELDATERGNALRAWHAAVWRSVGVEHTLPPRWWDAG
jgi:hypothetical protein